MEKQREEEGMIWGLMIQLGHNMWGESLPDGVKTIKDGHLCRDHVNFNEDLWNKLVERLVLRNMNLVVIDLGEFPIYPSHPELAIKGSRSPDWIRTEVRRLKKLGLEPIPKLNFSAAHDAWLGEYSRMLTTKPYYQVCRDVIKDTSDELAEARELLARMEAVDWDMTYVLTMQD